MPFQEKLTYTSYAVWVQMGRFTRWKPDAPAAAWYFFVFSGKFGSESQIFRKRMSHSTLPEAKTAVVGVRI
jgi:hypothetical protein